MVYSPSGAVLVLVAPGGEEGRTEGRVHAGMMSPAHCQVRVRWPPCPLVAWVCSAAKRPERVELTEPLACQPACSSASGCNRLVRQAGSPGASLRKRGIGWWPERWGRWAASLASCTRCWRAKATRAGHLPCPPGPGAALRTPGCWASLSLWPQDYCPAQWYRLLHPKVGAVCHGVR